jgi:CMP-N-acetylneuraminic acid synthetase
VDASDLLIVVPARGGSKGLPRKNARVLGDLPLLGWTAQAIAQSGLQHATCILSTDDEEIAAIGRDVGLEAPFLRPADIAGDTASAQSVALHALDWLQRTRNITPDYVMWLQPTSPFRPPQSITRAYEMIRAGSRDAVVGVKAIHRSPDTLFHLGADDVLTSLGDGTRAATRRQDVTTLYTPNGAMYVVHTRVLREQTTFFPKHGAGLVMDQIESLDIDDATDWAIADAVARAGSSWRRG